jgi:AAA15 family ATPase/GTPase
MQAIFNETLYQLLNEIKEMFTDRLNHIVLNYKDQGRFIDLVPISNVFSGYELRYTHMMSHYLQTNRFDIHPNQAGYDAMARSFAEVIWKEYQLIHRHHQLTVILNGAHKGIDFTPITIHDQLFLPLRDSIHAFDGRVFWDSRSRLYLSR